MRSWILGVCVGAGRSLVLIPLFNLETSCFLPLALACVATVFHSFKPPPTC